MRGTCARCGREHDTTDRQRTRARLALWLSALTGRIHEELTRAPALCLPCEITQS